ncbi:MAG TPA: class I SAM-dependent methyltransferase [Casimicrobiaceae bacterium]|nr:class I SAM-dependent methyltransferase [Casimicrobiaceae bacterium]
MRDDSPQLFLDHLLGFQKTAALKAAVALDLFSVIAMGDSTSAAIARRVGAAERGIRILCDFLTVNGHLEKNGDRYRLTPSSAMFLDRASPACIVSVVDFLAAPVHLRRFLDDPVAYVRNGGSLGAESTAPNDAAWVTFAKSMAPFIAPVAQDVASAIVRDGKVPRTILDIAAGHGLFGIALAQKAAGAKVIALDAAAVLAVARENAGKAGLGARFSTIEGDAFKVDWGRDYDVVLLPNFLHHFDVPTNESLLRRARGALAPGGRVVVVEMVPNDDRVTPPFPAAFAFMMLGGTPRGDAYTLRELSSVARAAGFANVSAEPLPPSPQTMIVCS